MFVQFLQIFICEFGEINPAVLRIKSISCSDHIFYFYILVDSLEVGHDLAIISSGDGVGTGDNQAKGEKVGIYFSVAVREDALPDPEGLEELVLLRK